MSKKPVLLGGEANEHHRRRRERHSPCAKVCLHTEIHSPESALGIAVCTTGESLRVLDTESLFLNDIAVCLRWRLASRPGGRVLSSLCSPRRQGVVWRLVVDRRECGATIVVAVRVRVICRARARREERRWWLHAKKGWARPRSSCRLYYSLRPSLARLKRKR